MSNDIIKDLPISVRELIEPVKIFDKSSYIEDEIYDEMINSNNKFTDDEVYSYLLLEEQGLTLGMPNR